MRRLVFSPPCSVGAQLSRLASFGTANGESAPTAPQLRVVEGRTLCDPCGVELRGPWHHHAATNEHKYMVVRRALEAGTEGCRPPPVGKLLRYGFVWCAMCETEVGLGAGGWAEHANGAEHRHRTFKQKAASGHKFDAPKAKKSRKPLSVG